MMSKETSDWLSPVLVKEMRQGLKSRAFVGAFLLVHLAMVAGLAFGLATESASRMREASAGLFWGVTVLSLLGLVPLLGFNAVSAELKGRTFELMVLTRLTAWRVVVGKWASLVAQALLVVSSLLPYLVVRYFIGGVNLVFELLVLAFIVFAGSCMIAMSVFVSTFELQLARLLMIGAQLGLSLMAVGAVVSVVASPMGAPRPAIASIAPGVAVIVFIAILVVLFVLQAAATRVAPAAENHAWLKRLFAVLLVSSSALPVEPDLRTGVLVALVPALLLVSLEACAEPISSAASAYRPFARWALPLRPLAALVYPGWPSGLLFTAVMAAVTGALVTTQSSVEAAQGAVSALCFLAAVALPVSLARLPKKLGPVGFVAVFVHLLLLLAAVLTAEALRMNGGVDKDVAMVVSPLITLGQAASGDMDATLYGPSAVAMAGYLLLSAILLAIRGRGDISSMLDAERRARLRGAVG